MRKLNFTVNVLLDKRTVLKGTNLSPLVLAVSSGDIQFRIGLKLYATVEDYKRALSNRGSSDEIRTLRKEMRDYVSKAETILERLPAFSEQSFKRLFKSEADFLTSDKTDITYLYQEKMAELQSDEQIGTAKLYRHSLRSFLRFKSPLYIEDIDQKFLKDYRNWMLAQGNSNSTSQIYLRHLKAIFNKAIKTGYISANHYPFKNYSIGTSVKSKDVLYPEQLKRFWEFQPKGVMQTRAKDYFFFCYLGNGMNFKDFCYLKYKNLKGDCLMFVREKTKRTTSVSDKEIIVYLHPEMRNIIERWGNKNHNPDDYVFKIHNGCKTIIDREKARKKYKRPINRTLRKIGAALGLNVSLCLNLARHSFATRLKLDGTPTAFITDALGHSSSKTTEHYLKSIPSYEYKNISQSLLQFD